MVNTRGAHAAAQKDPQKDDTRHDLAPRPSGSNGSLSQAKPHSQDGISHGKLVVQLASTPTAIRKDDIDGCNSDETDSSWVEKQRTMPDKRGSQLYRNSRWLIWSAYRRLFAFIFMTNLIVAIALAAKGKLDFRQCATGAGINILLSILGRQEHVINLLFSIATSLPLSCPLSIRRLAAKVYCYGGLHSGYGVAGFVWYIGFTGFITHATPKDKSLVSALVLAYGTLILLLLIIVFAHPTIRQKMHDQFEVTHRFAGWTVVAFYWAQICLLARAQEAESELTFGRVLAHTPAFWCVLIITACLVYPWIRLRRRDVRVEKLSNHATRFHFSHGKIDRCMGVRLSTSPLIETHAFATIPTLPGVKGYSCIISNAGDWTKRLIQEREPRTKIWMKGAPTRGFLQVATLFQRIVLVATGSGIGPCLSLINGNNDAHCRILWSTIRPYDTYGHEIVRSVLGADGDAVIIDTKISGRPNLVTLAYQLYVESKAEAVIVISNPMLTRKLVYGMECRGVPAYGPIFDS